MGSDGRVIHWVSSLDKKEWQLPFAVNGLALSADGRHLTTANGNGTIYVLRLAPVAALAAKTPGAGAP